MGEKLCAQGFDDKQFTASKRQNILGQENHLYNKMKLSRLN